MKNLANLIGRLSKQNPKATPVFKNATELLAWNQSQQLADSKKLSLQNAQGKVQRIMDKSGISEKLKRASFKNYHAHSTGQSAALNYAFNYAKNFASAKPQPENFIFFGNFGTGKNHLASAMANELMGNSKTVLIATVSAIVSEVNRTYRNDATRTDLNVINDYTTPDLLIIDEVGLQKGSDHERLQLTTIIDKRVNSFKPTGILTNLDVNEIQSFIGVRAFDRLHEGGCNAVEFSWGSYRRNGNAA